MIVSIKLLFFPMTLPAEGAFLKSWEEGITAGQAAVTKAQETLDEWTARLHHCYESRRRPSTDSSEIQEDIYWLTEQVDKAREALAKREEALAKREEALAKSRGDFLNARKEFAKSLPDEKRIRVSEIKWEVSTLPPLSFPTRSSVFVPPSESSTETDLVDGIDTPLKYRPSLRFFKLPSEYLANTGLPCDKDIIVFCRDLFHKQWKFMEEQVLENGILGWILGPPGTGKSTTALAFASTIDREMWVVTWIHLNKSCSLLCLRFDGDLKKAYNSVKEDRVEDFLNLSDSSRKHIVFVDGYTSGDTDIQKSCIDWVRKNRNNRRLLIVSSMASRTKSSMIEDDINKLEEFYVFSWEKDDYLKAVQNETFFESVEDCLDSSHNVSISDVADSGLKPEEFRRRELVESKLYFAGGSSRFMFHYPTYKVIDHLEFAVRRIGNVEAYVNASTGVQAEGVINRLFNVYRGHCTSITSRYAAFLLANKVGPALIKHLAKAVGYVGNPSFDGWMFEMWFFACLSHNGVKLYDKDGYLKHSWDMSVVLNFRNSAGFPILSDDRGTWLKPAKWNQGGYDAVFIDRSCDLVRFVQVTRSQTHALKIEFFVEFLRLLGASDQSFEVKKVEVVFVVDKTVINRFKISPVTGEGGLAVFSEWKKGTEKIKAQVYGLDGWNLGE